MKLVIADDHTLFRNGLALLLKSQVTDCEVLEGDSVDAALAQVAAVPGVQLALLDLNMPGMDGVEGIRRFANQYPCVPVVVLTGAEAPQQIQQVLGAGASGFIPKSSTPAVMLSAIRLVLAGGTYIPPQMLAGMPSGTPSAPAHAGTRERAASMLTERQMQVLRLMAQGKPNKLICRELDIEAGTVKAHIASIFRVLDVVNRTEAVVQAKELGLL
jgi:DNA-binding NarL/FixJ family response regulator